MLLSAFLALALVLCISANSAIDTSSTLPAELTVVPTFAVEGHASLTADMFAPLNWQANSRVLLDYGKYTGFVKCVFFVLLEPLAIFENRVFRQDGSFVVESVPTGSYILEIANVDYIFEPIRVDINSKGKIRARKLNILQVCAFLLGVSGQKFSFVFSQMPFTRCLIRCAFKRASQQNTFDSVSNGELQMR